MKKPKCTEQSFTTIVTDIRLYKPCTNHYLWRCDVFFDTRMKGREPTTGFSKAKIARLQGVCCPFITSIPVPLARTIQFQKVAKSRLTPDQNQRVLQIMANLGGERGAYDNMTTEEAAVR